MWLKGNMASSQPQNDAQIGAQIDDPESSWCHTYFKFILNSNRLRDLQQEIKDLVGIVGSCDKLFPKYGKGAKDLFHDWLLLDNTNTLEERKSHGRGMKNILIEPKGADLIVQVSLGNLREHPGLPFDRSKVDAATPEYTYVSELLETIPKQININDRQRLDNSRIRLKNTAMALEDQWDVLKNGKWME